jgi:osmotically inducible protein OsmC
VPALSIATATASPSARSSPRMTASAVGERQMLPMQTKRIRMGDRMPSGGVRDDCTMANAERTATTVWEGDLAHGSGVLSLKSGAAPDLPVTWASRTERSDGKTSPEELIAAAHASCFSMALSHELAQAGNAPERLDVSATVTLSMDDGPKVTSSHLTVRGVVPGLDADGFAQAAQGAADGCPISGALKGNLEITVDAQLAGG